MRGPSTEERQNSSAHVVAPSQGQNLAFPRQYEQHVPQESANYNGNNRSSYHWRGVPEHGNTEVGRYQIPTRQEQPAERADDSNPFAEYAWMVDADEFDKQMMEQMEQEEYLESCFEQMWQEEENEAWFIPQRDGSSQRQIDGIDRLPITDSSPPTMLNPNAAEFVPRHAVVHN